MIDLTKTFEHAEFTSRLQAIQVIRSRLEVAGNPLDEASNIIKTLFSVERTFTDKRIALYTTQYSIDQAYMDDLVIDDDVEYLVNEAEIKAVNLLNNPKYAFCFVEPEANNDKYVEQSQAIAGISVTVPLRKDGKIKKGGKQVLAAELYKTRILTLTTPIENQAIIAMFSKELGMSKPGATTYVGNCIKEFGAPAVGIIKGKKGKASKSVDI